MKITEVLLEYQVPEELKGVKIANVAGADITVGDVQKFLPSADPKSIIKYGTKINDLLQTKPIDGVDYTVGNAIVDVATALPLGRALKGAKTGFDVAKALGANELRRQVGRAAADQVELMPSLTGGNNESKSSTKASIEKAKQRKYSVGDKIPVKHNGKTFQLTVKDVLPSGYSVDASTIPGNKPGQTMTVPEPA